MLLFPDLGGSQKPLTADTGFWGAASSLWRAPKASGRPEAAFGGRHSLPGATQQPLAIAFTLLNFDMFTLLHKTSGPNQIRERTRPRPNLGPTKSVGVRTQGQTWAQPNAGTYASVAKPGPDQIRERTHLGPGHTRPNLGLTKSASVGARGQTLPQPNQ